MAKKFNNKDKTKVWKEFSKFVIARDALATTGTLIACVCITCGKQYSLDYIQAGHLIAGRRNAVLFNEKLVNGQCRYCNLILHGNTKKYEQVIIERYGQEWLDEERIKAKRVIQDKDMKFEGKAIEYKRRHKELMESNGHYTLSDRLKEIRK